MEVMVGRSLCGQELESTPAFKSLAYLQHVAGLMPQGGGAIRVKKSKQDICRNNVHRHGLLVRGSPGYAQPGWKKHTCRLGTFSLSLFLSLSLSLSLPYPPSKLWDDMLSVATAL